MTAIRAAFRVAALAILGGGPVRAQIASAGVGAGARVLRVCADPNNLPFSNANRDGFENKIADVLATATGARVEYTWWAQRRGFVRNTLGARECDAIIGMPTASDMVATTRPYYRSTYVIVSRADARHHVRSLDDPALRSSRIGVHFIGADYGNPPVVQALVNRGLGARVVGYSIYGDYATPNPPAALIDAVARGDVDVAIVWGPLAGYFAPRERVPLVIAPVSSEHEGAGIAYAFDISVAVRRGDDSLKAALQHALDTHRGAIRAILDRYHVPQLEPRMPRGGN